MTTAGEKIDYYVLHTPPSSGSRKNRSVDEGGGGGWEKWWKRGKELSCRGKIADYFSEGDNKEPFDVKSKETGRLRREEGGVFSGLPPAALQPQMMIGDHDSEEIPNTPVALVGES